MTDYYEEVEDNSLKKETADEDIYDDELYDDEDVNQDIYEDYEDYDQNEKISDEKEEFIDPKNASSHYDNIDTSHFSKLPSSERK